MSLVLRIERSESKDGNFVLDFKFGIEPSLENQAKMYKALFNRRPFDLLIEKEIIKLGFENRKELMKKIEPKLIKLFAHRAPGIYFFKVNKNGKLREEFGNG